MAGRLHGICACVRTLRTSDDSERPNHWCRAGQYHIGIGHCVSANCVRGRVIGGDRERGLSRGA